MLRQASFLSRKLVAPRARVLVSGFARAPPVSMRRFSLMARVDLPERNLARVLVSRGKTLSTEEFKSMVEVVLEERTLYEQTQVYTMMKRDLGAEIPSDHMAALEALSSAASAQYEERQARMKASLQAGDELIEAWKADVGDVYNDKIKTYPWLKKLLKASALVLAAGLATYVVDVYFYHGFWLRDNGLNLFMPGVTRPGFEPYRNFAERRFVYQHGENTFKSKKFSESLSAEQRVQLDVLREDAKALLATYQQQRDHERANIDQWNEFLAANPEVAKLWNQHARHIVPVTRRQQRLLDIFIPESKEGQLQW